MLFYPLWNWKYFFLRKFLLSLKFALLTHISLFLIINFFITITISAFLKRLPGWGKISYSNTFEWLKRNIPLYLPRPLFIFLMKLVSSPSDKSNGFLFSCFLYFGFLVALKVTYFVEGFYFTIHISWVVGISCNVSFVSLSTLALSSRTDTFGLNRHGRVSIFSTQLTIFWWFLQFLWWNLQ